MMMQMIRSKGIDVSHWQGTIDFNKVKSNGVDFVIIKAGGSDNGFYKDKKFESYYKGAVDAGLHVGAYYFVGKNCTSKKDGVADAKRFMKIIKDKQFSFPVVLDYEAPNALDPKGNTAAAIGFCDTLESNKYYVSIYASDISGFKDRLQIDKVDKYDKWVAKYSKEPTYVKNYGLWQYSSHGKLDGITGYVDLNVSYKNYPDIIKRAKLNGY